MRLIRASLPRSLTSFASSSPLRGFGAVTLSACISSALSSRHCVLHSSVLHFISHTAMQSTALGVKPACRRAPPSGNHAQALRSHKANACAVPLAGSCLHSSRCKRRPVLALPCLSGIPSARVAPASGRQAGNPTAEKKDSAERTDSFFPPLIFGLLFSSFHFEN